MQWGFSMVFNRSLDLNGGFHLAGDRGLGVQRALCRGDELVVQRQVQPVVLLLCREGEREVCVKVVAERGVWVAGSATQRAR